jgi:hypothetical protein
MIGRVRSEYLGLYGTSIKIQVRAQIHEINPGGRDKPDETGLDNVAEIYTRKMDSIGLINEQALPANTE